MSNDVVYLHQTITTKTINNMKTFIIIDTLAGVHAHIKATTPKEAKTIYADDSDYLNSITFAVTEQQLKSFKQ